MCYFTMSLRKITTASEECACCTLPLLGVPKNSGLLTKGRRLRFCRCISHKNASSSRHKKSHWQNASGFIHKEWGISVDAVIRLIVLIPQILAGGSHGASLKLPNDRACYQLTHKTGPEVSIKMFGQHTEKTTRTSQNSHLHSSTGVKNWQ